MRVAVDATALLGARTGVGVFTAELLKRLALRPDLDGVAYAASWRGRSRFPGLVPTGIAAARRPMAATALRRSWRRWDWPPIEWWTGPVDVVHGPNFVVPPTRRGAGVVTVHDLTPVRFPELCHRDTLAYPGLIRRALDRGAFVHAVSRFVADEVIEHFGIDPERVVAIPNGLTPVARVEGDAGRRLAGGDRYVLALGTVEPRKDLPSLVRAFDAVADEDPELRLVVAGPEGWGVADLDQACRDARHRDRVVRLGWVDDDARAALLAGAAVFAFPSRYEGFGLPPLEAMSAGVPVVATAAGALPEVLGDAAELVDVGDRAALADALRTVLHDGARRSELVELGRATAGRYSWDRTVDALVDLYRTAYQASSRPSTAPS